MIKIIRNMSGLRALILGLALMVFSPFVFSQGVSVPPTANVDLTVSGDDQSLKLLLEPLFGSAVYGSTISPLGDIFALLNAIVLMVGGVFLAYTLVIGTLNTAHDGEMMGKKWSSVWVPIRTALGVAAVFPMANGFSMIQVFVLWCVMQGVGGANAMWAKFADTTATTPYHNAKLHDKASLLAENILRSEICSAVFNHEQKILQDAAVGVNLGKQVISLTPYKSSTAFVKVSTGYSYNLEAEKSYDQVGYCGGFYFEINQPKQANGANTSNLIQDIKSISAIDADNVDGKFNELNSYQLEQAVVMANQLRSIVPTFLYNHETNEKQLLADVKSNINSVALTYETNVNSKAKELFDSVAGVEDMKTALKKDGWLMAGSYYMKIISLQEKMNTMVTRLPSYKTPSANLETDSFGEYKIALGRMKSALSQNIEDNALENLNQSENDNSDKSMVTKAVESFLQDYSSLITGNNAIFEQSDSGANPVIQAQQTGNNLMMAGEIGMGLSVAATLIPRAGDAIFSIGQLISIALISFGALLALYIPMMPYILWMGAILGWIILVIEGVVAAPLWAAMHIHPHGDDFAGKGHAGYTLLLSLVLKPILMIIGFIFAILLMNPVGQVINATFGATFKMVNGDSFMGLFTTIAGIAIYIALMHHSMSKIFGLINELPDHILRWVGHARESLQLGEYSQGMHKSSQSMFVNSMSTTNNAMGNLGRSLNADRPKNGKDNMKDEKSKQPEVSMKDDTQAPSEVKPKVTK